MRTTLEIDDRILEAVREIAARRGESLGKVVSVLLEERIWPPVAIGEIRNGFPTLPPRPNGRPYTMRELEELIEESGY
jgi:hypothetical protein